MLKKINISSFYSLNDNHLPDHLLSKIKFTYRPTPQGCGSFITIQNKLLTAQILFKDILNLS